MAKPASKTDQINEAVASKNWNRLAEICENFELEAPISEGTPPLPFYGFHLFAYILQNDLNNARFLWKRIPVEVKKNHPEFSAIWKIGQALWNRNYDQLWPSLAQPWSGQYAPLVAILAETLRARIFSLLSKSYTSISVDDAAVFLGMTPKDLIAKAISSGWQHDAASNMLSPSLAHEPKIQNTGPEHLKQLTDYVVFLEQ